MVRVINTAELLETSSLDHNAREWVIELTRGYTALVSASDFDRINSLNWFACVGEFQVRAARMQNRQMIYMHHEVLEIMPWQLSGKEIDHIDNNTLNNTRENLRVITHTENMRNTKRHKERKGYSFNYRSNSYCCYIDEPDKPRKYI